MLSCNYSIQSYPESIVKVQLDEQILQFITYVDALTERLTPDRRPQDAAIPECSRQELKTLTALGRGDTLTMSDLAAILKVQLSTATHIVDKLEAKGLVERMRVKQDRRIVQVKFSRKGKRIHQYVIATRMAAAREMLEGLDPEARRDFLQRMAKLVD